MFSFLIILKIVLAFFVVYLFEQELFIKFANFFSNKFCIRSDCSTTINISQTKTNIECKNCSTSRNTCFFLFNT